MADIVVTTPKGRMAEAAQEAEDVKGWGGGWYVRRIGGGQHPDVGPGDRVFYVEDGFIRGYAIVAEAGFMRADQVCETTGRRYCPGFYVVMDAKTWTWIRPIPMRGFMGWRYAVEAPEWPVEILGGWLDPRPEVGQMGLM